MTDQWSARHNHTPRLWKLLQRPVQTEARRQHAGPRRWPARTEIHVSALCMVEQLKPYLCCAPTAAFWQHRRCRQEGTSSHPWHLMPQKMQESRIQLLCVRSNLVREHRFRPAPSSHPWSRWMQGTGIVHLSDNPGALLVTPYDRRAVRGSAVRFLLQTNVVVDCQG